MNMQAKGKPRQSETTVLQYLQNDSNEKDKSCDCTIPLLCIMQANGDKMT